MSFAPRTHTKTLQRKMLWIHLVTLLFGSGLCFNELNDDDIKKAINGIPGLENLNHGEPPSVDEVQSVLTEKCRKNGGPDVVKELAKAKDAIIECIESNFNFTQIQEELNVARKFGAMEEVFEKYCIKKPVVMDCLNNLSATIRPCLEEKEKPLLELIRNVTDNLANFICFRNGDRIAMFVAEGGFECLQSKKEGIEQCANKSFAHYVPANISIDNLPLLIINEDSCSDYDHFKSCVVRVVSTCDEKTPGNVVEALFKYLHRISPCKSFAPEPLAIGTRGRSSRSFNDQAGNPSLQNIFQQIKDKYEPHCRKNGGDKAAENFYRALEKVQNCSTVMQLELRRKMQELQQMPYDYMCSNFRKGVRRCLVDLTDKIEECSSPQEAYVPKFGVELYDSVFNFYCKDDKRALKRVVEDKDICMRKILNSTSACLDKTKHIRTFDKDDVVTKKELCSDMKLLRGCILDYAVLNCPLGHSNEFVFGLSDAVYAPCSGCRMSLCGLLLMTLVLVVKLLK